MPLTLLRHTLADEALAGLRDRQTPARTFRLLSRRIGLLLAAEATRELPRLDAMIETPLESTHGSRLGGRVVAVPVLRAGLGLLEPFLELAPEAEVGYFGLERDEHTAVARCYYQKLPPRLAEAAVFVLDPMLATGGSAVAAISALGALGARDVRLVCVVAAPEGVAYVESRAPGTPIVAAALDRALDPRKFILPGLGDYGDRLFGT
jgi:uracil phosphoribosyltransferase